MAPVSKPPAASSSSPVEMDKDGNSVEVGNKLESDTDHQSTHVEFDAVQNSILSKQVEPLPKYIYKAHWQIFAPTFVICFLYVLCWVILYLIGKSGDSLARVFIIVMAVGVPILFAHAFLRYQTISIEIFEKYLRYHAGWPKIDPVIIPFDLIKKVSFTKSLSGRVFGGGTAILQLVAGDVIGIADVKKIDEAQENIAAMLK